MQGSKAEDANAWREADSCLSCRAFILRPGHPVCCCVVGVLLARETRQPASPLAGIDRTFLDWLSANAAAARPAPGTPPRDARGNRRHRRRNPPPPAARRAGIRVVPAFRGAGTNRPSSPSCPRSIGSSPRRARNRSSSTRRSRFPSCSSACGWAAARAAAAIRGAARLGKPARVHGAAGGFPGDRRDARRAVWPRWRPPPA